MRSRILLATVAGLLAIALAAATALTVQRSRELTRVRDRLERLEQQLQDRTRAGEPPRGGDRQAGGSPGTAAPGAACLTGAGAPAPEATAGGPPPREPQALVDHIARQVAGLRGLELQHDIDAQLLAPEQLAQRAVELFLADYTSQQAESDRRLLAALGAVERGADLRAAYRRLLSGQVAGFYVPSTGELVARGGGDALSPTDRVILAHEIDHAVTDQVLGLPGGDDDADTDRQLAAAAVSEGDASLVMQRWALANLGLAEQLELATDPAAVAAAGDLEQAPHYLAQQLVFPYLDGLAFVCRVYLDGGWEAVNDLYRDPPASSAQVMFPGRYRPGRQPAEPAELTAPPGWRQRATDSFGAAQLSWLLEAPGGARERGLDDVRSRIGAWAGGSATVWEDGADTAVGLSLVDGGDGGQLCATMTAWYAAAFPQAASDTSGPVRTFDGAEQDAAVRCGDGRVAVGIGPGLEVARAVAG